MKLTTENGKELIVDFELSNNTLKTKMVLGMIVGKTYDTDIEPIIDELRMLVFQYDMEKLHNDSE